MSAEFSARLLIFRFTTERSALFWSLTSSRSRRRPLSSARSLLTGSLWTRTFGRHHPVLSSEILARILILRRTAKCLAFFFARTAAGPYSPRLSHHLRVFFRHHSRCDRKGDAFFNVFFLGTEGATFCIALAGRRFYSLSYSVQHFFRICRLFRGHKSGRFREIHAHLHVLRCRTVRIACFFAFAWRRCSAVIYRGQHFFSLIQFLSLQESRFLAECYAHLHVGGIFAIRIALLFVLARWRLHTS